MDPKDLPAFPERCTEGYDNDGMGLRDYFAAHIFQGMLAAGAVPMPFQEGWEAGQKRAARQAWALADEMLMARQE